MRPLFRRKVMKTWVGEANGNSFHVLLGEEHEHSLISKYLDNLRQNKLWRCDSALILTPHSNGGVGLRVVERDGSESAMCGNGLRVVGRLLDLLGRPRMVVVNGQIISIQSMGNCCYRTELPIREFSRWRQFRRYGGHVLQVGGELHVVLQVTDAHAVPLADWGRYVVPWANCTAVSRHGRGQIRVRTFERGVNAITGSCGTGACAAAWAVRHGSTGETAFDVYMHHQRLRVDLLGHANLEGNSTIYH